MLDNNSRKKFNSLDTVTQLSLLFIFTLGIYFILTTPHILFFTTGYGFAYEFWVLIACGVVSPILARKLLISDFFG